MSDEEGRTVEHHLRAAVESSPSGLIMVDPEGRIVLVNREVERLFGYAREELLGRSVDLLVPNELQDRHIHFRERFLEAPSARAMGAGRDLHGLRKDGTRVPVEIGLTPVPTERGLCILSSIVDITARRGAEARFRAAVESSPSGMVMVDQAGKIVMVNREVERLFGYNRQELIGSTIERLVPERFRGEHPAYRKGFYTSPHARAMGAGRDLFGLRKDGTEIPIEIGLNPIEMDEGMFVLSSIVDISERQRQQRDREHLEAQLRQAQKLEAVGTLAGGVAHDFNNILGAILGYAELIEMQDLKESARRDLEDLKGFVDRGRTVVQRIQAFSRPSEVTRVPLALSRPVEEVARFLRASVGPGIQIDTRVAPNCPRVLADPSAMHQIVMNLGLNGAQAMKQGGRLSLTVDREYITDHRVRLHPHLHEGDHVVLSVRDTGVGIPSEELERVFEPYFTTKAPGSGSGLGLSIVHGIVREHTGAVEIDSAVGSGTTVRVILPPIDQPEVEVATAPDVQRGRGEHILYIDDEPALRTVARRGLERMGYRVTAHSSGERAIEVFLASPGDFDAVVTDHLMPTVSGLDLARAISQRRPELPIVLFTGFVDHLAEQEIAETGVCEVLSKPTSIKILAGRLRALLDAAPSSD